MANAPVFGRRGASERPLPTLAQLAPSEPSAEDMELAGWKQELQANRRRYLRGWGGVGMALGIVAPGLGVLGFHLVAIPLGLAGLACLFLALRKP